MLGGFFIFFITERLFSLQLGHNHHHHHSDENIRNKSIVEKDEDESIVSDSMKKDQLKGLKKRTSNKVVEISKSEYDQKSKGNTEIDYNTTPPTYMSFLIPSSFLKLSSSGWLNLIGL